MRKVLARTTLLGLLLLLPLSLWATEEEPTTADTGVAVHAEAGHSGDSTAPEGTHEAGSVETGTHHALPPVWLVAPFALLLILIVTGPLFYPHFWEHHYPKVAMGPCAILATYYGFLVDTGLHTLRHTLVH